MYANHEKKKRIKIQTIWLISKFYLVWKKPQDKGIVQMLATSSEYPQHYVFMEK